MKIKRFIAEDIRTALRKVSTTLGPDAVILSNNRVDDGVEIVAAIDYDDSLINPTEDILVATQTQENKQSGLTAATKNQIDQRKRKEVLDDLRFARNIPTTRPVVKRPAKKKKIDLSAKVINEELEKEELPSIWTKEPAFVEMQSELKSLRGLLVNQLSGLSWGKETQYHPLRARLLQRLTSLGLSSEFAHKIAFNIDEKQDFEHNWRLALGELAQHIPVGENEIIDKGGVIALVGATGVGKTTTIAKLAARYTLKHGAHRVALITTDNYRVAAHEQLRSYASILGVPLRVAGDAESLRDAFESLKDKELILIDTAGMSQRDMMLNKQFDMLHADGMPMIKTYLTLATNYQRAVLSETGAKFNSMNLAGCILTKVDETTSLGGALMVAIENNLPISYICDGQQVPEDLHLARPLSIVSRSVSIMQHMESVGHHDEAMLSDATGMVVNGHG